MWIKVIFLVWICVHLADGLTVDIGTPGCDFRGSELVCDFNNTEEVVSVKTPLDTSVSKLSIQNAEKLVLTELLCVNLFVDNVSEVSVIKDGIWRIQKSHNLDIIARNARSLNSDENDVDDVRSEDDNTINEESEEDEDMFLMKYVTEETNCKNELELTGKASVLQKIPEQYSRIHLEDCTIASLVTTANISSLAIIDSNVGLFDITSPLTRGARVTVLNSSIETFQHVELQEGSELLLSESRVTKIASESIVVTGGSFVIKESSFGSISDDSALDFQGETSLNNNIGIMKLLGEGEDAYRHQNLSLSFSNEEQSSFYGEMIAVSIALGLVSVAFLMLVWTVWRKSSKSIAGGRDVSTLDGKSKAEENESRRPLLEDISPEVKEDLETLIKEVTLGVNEETSSYLSTVNELTDNYQLALNSTQKETKEKELKLDADMKSELQSVEQRYNRELREPTMFNWEKIKEILLKSNEAEVELVRDKYRERKYDIQNHCDVHKLHYNVALLRQNKQHLVKLSEVGRAALIRWGKIRAPSAETRDEASAHGRLFNLLESLLINLKCDLEQSYEREILEEDKKYSQESETQQEKLARKMENIESEFKEESKKLDDSKREEMDYSSLWNTQYVRGKAEILYNIKIETAKILHSLHQKKAQDKYSDVCLKLRHLEDLINLQIRHITNMEKLLTMVIDTLTIYGQVTGRMSVQTLEDQLNLKNVPRGSKKHPELFLSLFSTTNQDEVDNTVDLEEGSLSLPLRVSHIYEQLEKELIPLVESQRVKRTDVRDGAQNQKEEIASEKTGEVHVKMDEVLTEKTSPPENRTEEKGEKESEKEQNKENDVSKIEEEKIEEESSRELQEVICHTATPIEDKEDKKQVELYMNSSE